MFNDDFYPTPAHVTAKMVAPYRDGMCNRHILEPSAGKGNIAEYIKTAIGYNGNLYCIESEPDLIATLQGKGFRILSNDFLKFTPSHIFDLIVMNPPFSRGVDHLLHAWSILDHGDIVCLLNAETLLNDCTEKRKLLRHIIAENGSIEYLGDAFKDAERKTGVEVALVRLHKHESASKWVFEATDEHESVQTISDDAPSEIAVKDSIGTLVDAYEAAKREFASVWKSRKKIAKYLAYIGGLTNVEEHYRSQDFVSHACNMDNPVSAYNFFVDTARMNAWNAIMTKTGIEGRVTESVRKDFNKMRTENGFDFTEGNIMSLLDGLVMNSGDIMKQCILEAFDLMTKYHKENRIHIEGWKSNDRWQVNRKIILPFAVEHGWSRGFKVRYAAQNMLDDIDKACCFLSGKGFDAIIKIRDAVEMSQVAVSDFFKVKSHHKGTLHLTFIDEHLWERFNLAAVEGKNWLPNKKGKA